jgi:hypothetical protein
VKPLILAISTILDNAFLAGQGREIQSVEWGVINGIFLEDRLKFRVLLCEHVI